MWGHKKAMKSYLGNFFFSGGNKRSFSLDFNASFTLTEKQKKVVKFLGKKLKKYEKTMTLKKYINLQNLKQNS